MCICACMCECVCVCVCVSVSACVCACTCVCFICVRVYMYVAFQCKYYIIIIIMHTYTHSLTCAAPAATQEDDSQIPGLHEYLPKSEVSPRYSSWSKKLHFSSKPSLFSLSPSLSNSCSYMWLLVESCSMNDSFNDEILPYYLYFRSVLWWTTTLALTAATYFDLAQHLKDKSPSQSGQSVDNYKMNVIFG